MEKKKKIQPPTLYQAIVRSLIEYCDEEGKIPYSKVKFVLRYKYRVPSSELGTILKEFCSFGLLIRNTQRDWEVAPVYIVKFNNGNELEV